MGVLIGRSGTPSTAQAGATRNWVGIWRCREAVPLGRAPLACRVCIRTAPPPTSHEPSYAEVTGHRQDPVVWAFSENLPAKEPSASNSLEPLKALTTAQLTPCKPFEALPSNLLCIFWSDLNQTSRNYPLGTV